jgi:hypothetical protein
LLLTGAAFVAMTKVAAATPPPLEDDELLELDELLLELDEPLLLELDELLLELDEPPLLELDELLLLELDELLLEPEDDSTIASDTLTGCPGTTLAAIPALAHVAPAPLCCAHGTEKACALNVSLPSGNPISENVVPVSGATSNG